MFGRYRAAAQKAAPKRAELIRELLQGCAGPRETRDLAAGAVVIPPPSGPQGRRRLSRRSTDAVAQTKNEKIKVEGAFVKARIKMIQGRASGTPGHLLPWMSSSSLPPRTRVAQACCTGRSTVTKDEKDKAAIEDRIVKEYPGFAVSPA